MHFEVKSALRTTIISLSSGGFRSTKLSTGTTLDTKHKATSLHVTPPDAKPMLADVALFLTSSVV